MLLQVVLHYRRIGDWNGVGPVPGVGLWLADRPLAADAADRALDAQPSAGRDIGPTKGGGLTEPEAAEGGVAGAGYGGLIGTAVDAARLLRLHLADGVIDGHRLLAPESARRMRQIDTPGRPFDLRLGWFRRPADRDATPAFVEHWGTGGGFWNAMRLYPDLDLGIVTMANSTYAYDHNMILTAVQAAFRP